MAIIHLSKQQQLNSFLPLISCMFRSHIHCKLAKPEEGKYYFILQFSMIFIMIEPQHFFLIFIISQKMEELISPVLQGTSLAQSQFLTSHTSCHFCFVCPIYLSPRTSNCLGKSLSTPPQLIQHLHKAISSFLFMSPLSHHLIQPLSFSHPLFYFTVEVQHNSPEHEK